MSWACHDPEPPWSRLALITLTVLSPMRNSFLKPTLSRPPAHPSLLPPPHPTPPLSHIKSWCCSSCWCCGSVFVDVVCVLFYLQAHSPHVPAYLLLSVQQQHLPILTTLPLYRNPAQVSDQPRPAAHTQPHTTARSTRHLQVYMCYIYVTSIHKHHVTLLPRNRSPKPAHRK